MYTPASSALGLFTLRSRNTSHMNARQAAKHLFLSHSWKKLTIYTCTQCSCLSRAFPGSPRRSSSRSFPGRCCGRWSGCTAAWGLLLPLEAWCVRRQRSTALQDRHSSATTEVVGEGALEDVEFRHYRRLVVFSILLRNSLKWEELFWASQPAEEKVHSLSG